MITALIVVSMVWGLIFFGCLGSVMVFGYLDTRAKRRQERKIQARAERLIREAEHITRIASRFTH